MSKDKSLTNQKIIEVAKREFLELGFEKASMRNIASKVGLTQAALYKHYKNKEEMFSSLVEPAIESLKELAKDHEKFAYDSLMNGSPRGIVSTSNSVTICKELLYKYPDEFKLLLCKSGGTRYENFINDVVNQETEGTYKAIEYIAKLHNQEVKVSKDEIHILLSAYLTAIFEPIVHDYPLDKALHVLNVIEKFFIPGWERIMGI